VTNPKSSSPGPHCPPIPESESGDELMEINYGSCGTAVSATVVAINGRLPFGEKEESGKTDYHSCIYLWNKKHVFCVFHLLAEKKVSSDFLSICSPLC
jgi:hypothetical protein